MYRTQQTIKYKSGQILRHALTTIYEADGVTLSDLFDLHGAAVANPTHTDAAGLLTFYTYVPAARYYQATNGVVVTDKVPLDTGHAVVIVDQTQVSLDLPAGGPVLAGYVVVANSVGAVIHGNNQDAQHADALIGVTANAALTGGTLKVVQEGELSNENWTLSPGQPVFVGINGALTQDPNQPGAVFQQQVGLALESTKIKVDIAPPIIFSTPR